MMYLESPDCTLQVRVMCERNSLAIKAGVLRIEAVDEENPHMIRAVVKVHKQYRSGKLYGVWEMLEEKAFMKTVGTGFLIPGYSCTLRIQDNLHQESAGGRQQWCLVEASSRCLDLEQPFSRINSYGQGEQCLILTIMSDKDESLEAFGNLLDDGGEIIENVYEPDEPEADDDDTKGEDIPEHAVAPELIAIPGEDERLEIGDLVATEHSPVKSLRSAATFLKVSCSGSKKKTFQRLKETCLESWRRQSVEVAHEQFMQTLPSPRVRDAPKQPTARERALREVTHLPYIALLAQQKVTRKFLRSWKKAPNVRSRRFNVIFSSRMDGKETVYS